MVGILKIARSITCTLAVALLLAGCMMNAIHPSVQPTTALIGQQIPKKVALVLTDDFRNYVYRGQPSSLTAALQTYDFNLGTSLSTALEDSLPKAFVHVEVMDTAPGDPGSFDLIVQPNVGSFDFAVNDSGGITNSFWFGALGAAATSYSSDVMLGLEANVATPALQRDERISVQGFGRKGASTFSWRGSDFNESSGAAITDAVNKLVSKLAGTKS
ncbi:MAG: hypothetical protein HQL36_03045 [Alphaproteobacteria bacterium]|nr:hypothetical protein [Alphaproteobacteria bacterium]